MSQMTQCMKMRARKHNQLSHAHRRARQSATRSRISESSMVERSKQCPRRRSKIHISLGSTPNDSKDPCYIQKLSFGSLFYPQETVGYPLDSIGCILIKSRAKAVSAWRTVNDFLPVRLKSILRNRLERF